MTIKMDYILYEQKGNIATITINREKALNALNSQVLDELNAALDAVDLKEVRCLVLTGAGQKSFVAGADIAEMSTLTKAEGEAFGKKGNDVFRKLETFPIPVIAAVNGFALGGGCEISMSCDIRLCSDNAVFGQPEVGLGITPGFGGTQRLARLVGAGMAKQMIYTARNIKAAEAYRIGLVNEVYSAETDAEGNVVKTAQEVLLAAAEKMAAGIAKNAPIARQAIALVVAAVAKFLTLYLVIVKWLVPMVLTLNEKQTAVLSASFSFPQLITAVIGGVLAMLLVPPLRRAIKD